MFEQILPLLSTIAPLGGGTPNTMPDRPIDAEAKVDQRISNYGGKTGGMIISTGKTSVLVTVAIVGIIIYLFVKR